MAGTGFGLNTPFNAPIPSSIPWGLSPHSGISVNPFMVPQLTGSSVLPFQQGNVFNPYATVPLQQIQQLLQIVPQQLQQLLQLEYLQQHQLQQLQQVLQFLPTQLAQLQQLTQFVPQHYQQIQQPFGAAGLPPVTPWGVSPQIGAQPNYVM
ncbi:MAG TPA: hypothetical protein VKE96_18520 [Vicinamibacterales bacterium]|nr:hypothetical protein [Vicinamibacterales bacterium]